MSSRRTLILIGAVVIGGLAAFLTLNYVRGVEDENASENQLVEVLVANGPIAKGASADEALATELVVSEDRRRADLPVGALSRPAEIAGLTAAIDLNGDEIITNTMFVADADLTGSKSTSLDKGNVAITINVDEAAGVAGLVQPGDSINILARVNTPAEEGAPEGGDSGLTSGDAYGLPDASIYVMQDVSVLAVGQSLGEPVAAAEGEAPAEQNGSGSGLITVQLPPDQAALLASVRNASLYLTLNRADYEPSPQPFSATVPELPGELGVSPYAADEAEDGQ